MENAANDGDADYHNIFGYQGYQGFSYGHDQLYNTDINQVICYLTKLKDLFAISHSLINEVIKI